MNINKCPKLFTIHQNTKAIISSNNSVTQTKKQPISRDG